MRIPIRLLFSIIALNVLFTFSVYASEQDIECDAAPPGALSAAVASAAPGTTINVTGTCNDAVVIMADDITLIGNQGSGKATITGLFPQERITIDGASRVNIEGFIIEQGIHGIVSSNNASFTLTDVDIRNNVLGIDITTGSTATFMGTVSIGGSQAFGLQVLTGASLVVEESASLIVENNFLGAQVSINSSFFVQTGGEVNVNDNSTIGFSVNTGSTGMLFNATLHSQRNGLDGLDVVSASNFEIDGESEVVVGSNGREGISIDNSTLNLFGFFSSQPGLPRIVANDNAVNGVFVESTSKLDIGRNSSIEAKRNGGAGVKLDDGSSAILQRSVIVDNRGELNRHKHHEHEHEDDRGHHKSRRKHRRFADVVATFGSRVSFHQGADNAGNVTPNQIGLALCDHTSLSRGDVRCY